MRKVGIKYDVSKEEWEIDMNCEKKLKTKVKMIATFYIGSKGSPGREKF